MAASLHGSPGRFSETNDTSPAGPRSQEVPGTHSPGAERAEHDIGPEERRGDSSGLPSAARLRGTRYAAGMVSISLAVRAALVGSLLAVAIVVSSCGSSQADGEVVVVPPREAVELIASRQYVVLDLRSAEAFEAGHVRGAVNLPAQAAEFDERLRSLDREGKYLLYSRDGESAERVADLMAAEGFEVVVDAGAFGLLAIAGAPLT